MCFCRYVKGRTPVGSRVTRRVNAETYRCSDAYSSTTIYNIPTLQYQANMTICQYSNIAVHNIKMHNKCTTKYTTKYNETAHNTRPKVRYSRHLGGRHGGLWGGHGKESRRYLEVAYHTRVEDVTKSVSPLNSHNSP